MRKPIAALGVVLVLLLAVIGLTIAGILPLGTSLETTTETFDWTDRDLIDRGLYVPDWSFSMVGNDTLTMQELRNKVTVLDFMAISCPACETQNGYTKSLYQEFGDTMNLLSLSVNMNETLADLEAYNLLSLTVNMNETLAELEAYASDQSLAWPFGIDTNAEASFWCGMMVIPMIVIVDSDGLLRWIHDGVWEFSGTSGMNATVHQIMS
jgi:thiol-disulfide isomerase/thioredoxin